MDDTSRKKQIDVCAAVIMRQETKHRSPEVLITRRAPGERMAGFWEFPGGKIEPGESRDHALVREIREELGMEIEILHALGNKRHEYEFAFVNLHVMLARIPRNSADICNGKKPAIVLQVHDEYAWCRVSELGKYRMAPADIPFMEILEKRFPEN